MIRFLDPSQFYNKNHNHSYVRMLLLIFRNCWYMEKYFREFNFYPPPVFQLIIPLLYSLMIHLYYTYFKNFNFRLKYFSTSSSVSNIHFLI